MNLVHKAMAVSGIAATIALSALGALPASAQTWHHHYRWHHRHHHYMVVRHYTVIHRHIVYHYPVHHIGTTVTKTVTHYGHTTVTKTVVNHP